MGPLTWSSGKPGRRVSAGLHYILAFRCLCSLIGVKRNSIRFYVGLLVPGEASEADEVRFLLGGIYTIQSESFSNH